MANEDIDITRLCSSIQNARLVLRKPREERVFIARQIAGAHYSEEGSSRIVPCNLLAVYDAIVGRKLVAHNPRCMLSTFEKNARPVVNAMEAWINKEIEKIDFWATLDRGVHDALMSMGIVKVGIATPADSATLGWNLSAGEPFAVPIDQDDYVVDVHARDRSSVAFEGHRYRVPLRSIRDSKIYSKDRKNLSASEDRIYNMEGDERINAIGQTTLAGQQEFEDMVDLWEIYLPRHRLVVTLHDDNLTGAGSSDRSDPRHGKCLRMQKWLGPDCGPYHVLGFGRVPGNLLPKGPMQDLVDLHISVNNVLRKLLRQCHDTKKLLAFMGASDADAERINNTPDGNAVRVDNPEKIRELILGEPNQQLFQMFVALRDLFSWLAGNLDIMGGLSPQSKTAHQDEMLNENSSATISEMQDRTVKWTRSIMTALCWYWHHDPSKVMKSHYSVPGLPGISLPRPVHPAGKGMAPNGKRRLSRDHSFEDMDINVAPYSMKAQTPESMLGDMNQLVTTIILPMQQQLQSQGVIFDIQEYLTKWAKYKNMPDITDLVSIQPPPQEDGGEGGPTGGSTEQPTAKPAETTRNYVRRSVGMGTQQGKEIGALNGMRAAPHSNGVSQ